ncbi:hypothetical protein THAOC_36998, partial [Thalassiosira oceanica]
MGPHPVRRQDRRHARPPGLPLEPALDDDRRGLVAAEAVPRREAEEGAEQRVRAVLVLEGQAVLGIARAGESDPAPYHAVRHERRAGGSPEQAHAERKGKASSPPPSSGDTPASSSSPASMSWLRQHDSTAPPPVGLPVSTAVSSSSSPVSSPPPPVIDGGSPLPTAGAGGAPPTTPPPPLDEDHVLEVREDVGAAVLEHLDERAAVRLGERRPYHGPQGDGRVGGSIRRGLVEHGDEALESPPITASAEGPPPLDRVEVGYDDLDPDVAQRPELHGPVVAVEEDPAVEYVEVVLEALPEPSALSRARDAEERDAVPGRDDGSDLYGRRYRHGPRGRLARHPHRRRQVRRHGRKARVRLGLALHVRAQRARQLPRVEQRPRGAVYRLPQGVPPAAAGDVSRAPPRGTGTRRADRAEVLPRPGGGGRGQVHVDPPPRRDVGRRPLVLPPLPRRDAHGDGDHEDEDGQG